MRMRKNQNGYRPGMRRHIRFSGGLFLTLVLCACLLAGCGPDISSSAEEDGLTVQGEPADITDTVRVVYSGDTASASLAAGALPESYETEEVSSSADAAEKLLSGAADIAVVRPYRALLLYGEEKNICCLGPLSIGGYAIYGDSGNMRLATVDGETAGESSLSVTPASLLNVTLAVWDTGDTLSTANACLRIDGGSEYDIERMTDENSFSAEYGTYNEALLINRYDGSEVAAAAASEMPLLDLDAYWQEQTGYPIPTSVVVVSASFLAERPDEVLTILADFQQAAADARTDSGLGSDLVFYGASDRGVNMLRTYYKTLYSGTSLADSIPDAAFYYQH